MIGRHAVGGTPEGQASQDTATDGIGPGHRGEEPRVGDHPAVEARAGKTGQLNFRRQEREVALLAPHLLGLHRMPGAGGVGNVAKPQKYSDAPKHVPARAPGARSEVAHEQLHTESVKGLKKSTARCCVGLHPHALCGDRNSRYGGRLGRRQESKGHPHIHKAGAGE